MLTKPTRILIFKGMDESYTWRVYLPNGEGIQSLTIYSSAECALIGAKKIIYNFKDCHIGEILFLFSEKTNYFDNLKIVEFLKDETI